MVTPGVSRPFTSSTANVVRSPEIIFRGSSKIRAFFATGAGCSSAIAPALNVDAATIITMEVVRSFIPAIVGENDIARKPGGAELRNGSSAVPCQISRGDSYTITVLLCAPAATRRSRKINGRGALPCASCSNRKYEFPIRTVLGAVHSAFAREEWISRNASPLSNHSTNSSATSGKRASSIFSFMVETIDCINARALGVCNASPSVGRPVALPTHQSTNASGSVPKICSVNAAASNLSKPSNTKKPINQVNGWINHNTSAENPMAWPGTDLSGPLRSAESSAFPAHVGTEYEYHFTSARNASRLSRNPLNMVERTQGRASCGRSAVRQRRGSRDKIVPKASLHIELQSRAVPTLLPAKQNDSLSRQSLFSATVFSTSEYSVGRTSFRPQSCSD